MRSGHPWVFADSIKGQNREGVAGELAIMYDRKDRFLAVGFYEPSSPIRIRVLHTGKPATIDREWWLKAARAALAKRQPDIINSQTNGARCINGESEGFPGLVADHYADTLVVKLYSASWLPHWTLIEETLREVFKTRYLVLRLSRNILSQASTEWALAEGFCGETGAEIVPFLENGILFESAVLNGQKTGFFLDQRDNRARVETLSDGRDVLNVFSFSGGFSLYAARGGASHVTDLDISSHALESAERNFRLNTTDSRIYNVARDSVQADAFEWIDEAPKDRTYDLIIVDPPSLAKRERERDGAIRAYHRLNACALRRLRPGGVLVAASCSAHIPADDFLELVRSIAHRSGRKWHEEWTSEHATDHPAAFREAKYLKAICLRMD